MDTPVAILGTGLMGQAMAQRLLDAGWTVVVWNRTPGRAAPLQAQGARVMATPAQAARAAPIWITMLADGPATASVWTQNDGLREAAARDRVWIQMGTLDYATTMQLAGTAQQHGIAFLDAPVLGGVGEARRGDLIIMAAGADAVIERVRPLFDVLGKKVVPAGAPGQGTLMKLASNLLLAHLVVGLCEWMNFGVQVGLDPLQMWEVIRSSKLNAPMFEGKFARLMDENYEPTFPLKWMRKDLWAIRQAAHAFGVYTPVAAAMERLYDAAHGQGLDPDDYTAVYQILRMLSRGFTFSPGPAETAPSGS